MRCLAKRKRMWKAVWGVWLSSSSSVPYTAQVSGSPVKLELKQRVQRVVCPAMLMCEERCQAVRHCQESTHKGDSGADQDEEAEEKCGGDADAVKHRRDPAAAEGRKSQSDLQHGMQCYRARA